MLQGQDFDWSSLKLLAPAGRAIGLSEDAANFVGVLKEHPERRNCERRSTEKNNAHFLPIAGFCQFFDSISDQTSFQRAEVINKENAVQMVDFVAEAPS